MMGTSPPSKVVSLENETTPCHRPDGWSRIRKFLFSQGKGLTAAEMQEALDAWIKEWEKEEKKQFLRKSWGNSIRAFITGERPRLSEQRSAELWTRLQAIGTTEQALTKLAHTKDVRHAELETHRNLTGVILAAESFLLGFQLTADYHSFVGTVTGSVALWLGAVAWALTVWLIIPASKSLVQDFNDPALWAAKAVVKDHGTLHDLRQDAFNYSVMLQMVKRALIGIGMLLIVDLLCACLARSIG
jgi:hypothetical protein